MIKILVWAAAAFAVAVVAPVNGHELAPEAADSRPAVSLQQPLLAAISAWLAFQFDLPSIEHPPRIELARPASIAVLRGGGGSEASSQQDIVAVYSDATRTIYLPEGWTGTTPTELSILVHELVHHVQNIAMPVRRSARSSPTRRRSDGWDCSDTPSSATSASTAFRCWRRHGVSIEAARFFIGINATQTWVGLKSPVRHRRRGGPERPSNQNKSGRPERLCGPPCGKVS
jgi:hypothetical protein